MQASALDYSRPDKMKDRVVCSYDGYSSFLLVIDEASRFDWIFLVSKYVDTLSTLGPHSSPNTPNTMYS
jgi:hypothetical protein